MFVHSTVVYIVYLGRQANLHHGVGELISVCLGELKNGRVMVVPGLPADGQTLRQEAAKR